MRKTTSTLSSGKGMAIFGFINRNERDFIVNNMNNNNADDKLEVTQRKNLFLLTVSLNLISKGYTNIEKVPIEMDFVVFLLYQKHYIFKVY